MPIQRSLCVLITVTAFSLGSQLLATASAAPIELGTAGPTHFAILTLGGGTDSSRTDLTANDSSVAGTVGIFAKAGVNAVSPLYWTPDTYLSGDVLLGSNALLSNSGVIDGTVLADPGALPVVNFGTIEGGVAPDPLVAPRLAQAVTDAIAWAAYYAELGCTICDVSTIFQPEADLTVIGGDTTNVLNLSHLWLVGQNVTLQAFGADARFVLNVSDWIYLENAEIHLAGDVTPDEVLINYTGEQAVRTNWHAQIPAILLAEHAEVYLSRAHVHGEVISGGSLVLLQSKTFVHGLSSDPDPVVTPEPASLWLVGSGGLWFWSRRRLATRGRRMSLGHISDAV